MVIVLLLALAGTHPASAFPQEEQKPDELRKQALDGFHIDNSIARLPLLERLAAANPDDAEVLARLATALLYHAATLPEAEARQAERKRARELAQRAVELGSKYELLEIILEIPPDGSVPPFSESPEVDAAMREGESAFSRGDMEAAVEAYSRAFALAPDLYEAPLFISDAYFKKKEYEAAGEWFARAIAVNPERETGYRYWGDALLLAGKTEAARDKHIEAILAQPYDRGSWRGLFNWAQRTGVQLSHPRIESPNRLEKKDDRVNITLDSDSLDAKDGRSAWIAYEVFKAGWQTSKFKEQFPEEKEYRHSLREEAESLRGVIEVLRAQIKDGKVEKLDPSLAALLKLEEEGLLEAYILFARVDEGIAQDYLAYRKSNREQLRRYLANYVAPLPAPRSSSSAGRLSASVRGR